MPSEVAAQPVAENLDTDMDDKPELLQLHERAATVGTSTPHERRPSHGIEIKEPEEETRDGRMGVRHMSAPALQSPMRHHKRAASRSKGVKETRNARSHYGSGDDSDGTAVHRINQYSIKQEIGRGSFGAVHLAVDQYGTEFAVKEFSKSRLRKRAQSNLLRKPNGRRKPPHLSAGTGFNSPLHRRVQEQGAVDDDNAFSLIKEEIAIMKKLSHNNLVALIEVLDDPDEDSLYMVLEICKKGVVMKVGLEERAEPYGSEACRCWFRDMILGMEYLHAQGIIHRDIKPDNCLVTSDDVLKIVDFGVSEMFDKGKPDNQGLATTKSAGSPAFMPPELCVPKHGQVSGKAADIWSMGVTLYCLRYGHIPFEKDNMLDLYDSIRNDSIPLEDEQDENFRDLMLRLLEKDPDKRITMAELRDHPWVTKDDTDRLLPTEENCADIVELPTEAEMNHAITGNMQNLFTVYKAVIRFKKAASRKRDQFTEGVFGLSRRYQPPGAMSPGEARRERSAETDVRIPKESKLATEGLHHDVEISDKLEKLSVDEEAMTMESAVPSEAATAAMEGPSIDRNQSDADVREHQQKETAEHRPSVQQDVQDRHRNLLLDDHAKGHAHDPLEDTLYLDIGASADAAEGCGDAEHPAVSESPSGVDENIYEQAYQEEMNRILKQRGQDVSLHLNRRVDHRDDLRRHPNILNSSRQMVEGMGNKLYDKIGDLREYHRQQGSPGFTDIAKAAQQKLEGRMPSDDGTGRGGEISMSNIVKAAKQQINEKFPPDQQRIDQRETRLSNLMSSAQQKLYPTKSQERSGGGAYEGT